GARGQQIVSALRVAVVGVGGTGSAVAEQLGRLGVHEMTIVDDDRFEESNLSRMWGSEYQDLRQHSSKVTIVARHLKQIRPALTVHTIQQSIIKQAVLERI